MKKRVWMVFGLTLFFVTMVLAFTLPVHSRPISGTGTCCPEVFSTCVIDTVVVQNNYYKSEGKCS